MPDYYRLPCQCGQSIPINLSQAGQEIVCPACGTTVPAPSLLGIKQLEPLSDGMRAGKVSESLRTAFFLIGCVLFLVGCTLLLNCLVPIPKFPTMTYPEAYQVLEKRTEFSYGGKTLPQDSTPISGVEQFTLMITDEDIDLLPPIDLYNYFLWLKEEQNFGGNFYENYQTLIDAFYIRVTAFVVLTLVGVGFFVGGFFMPKRREEVTGWSGSEW